MLRLLLLLLPFAAIGQHLVTPTNQVIKNRWEARWIGPKDKLNSYGVHHFRKTFSLSQKPHEFIIHISADNRYRLFVNGTYVTDGPQISDSRHWRFESLDIGPLLQSGNNVLAVQVVNFAEAAPVYVM
ncbi:MAG TPA: alpha-L-rhamnosidase, partial [Cyclobacteriaceae bacterium]|nr:alpha-L-rhamnosidase [Cyclobacteriaceae bacterium]